MRRLMGCGLLDGVNVLVPPAENSSLSFKLNNMAKEKKVHSTESTTNSEPTSYTEQQMKDLERKALEQINLLKLQGYEMDSH